MKVHIASLILTTAASTFCLAQIAGNPEDSGLIPLTPTFYVNTNYFNNGGGESPGVAIAANGNVIIGWEDDGSGIADFESVWSLFDRNGNLLTPPTFITNFDGTASITNTFLSYFRTNGTPIPGAYAFAPKIKANLFGNGIGMGAVAYDPIGSEIGYLEAINEEDGGAFGDFPAVQTLNNDGSPASATGVLTGVSDADAQPTGNIRIGDWDYLSNGNIVIVDESRQNDDLVNRFGGAAAGNHATFRIVSPAGAEVKAYSLVSANPTANSIWHGSGVTSNGFAVRFNSGGTKVRMFDNTGNPTSADIDLATLTGIAATSGGGRGDGTGFHGNGKDAYLYVTSGAGGVYITVLNANGTLRYARNVADTNETIVADRVDGAIAPDGRVIAVWDSQLPNARGDVTNRLVQARLFSASGQPLGGRFVVSEWENPANTNTVNVSQIPRVAWRGNTIAVIWLSQNAPTSLSDPLAPPYPQVVAARLFTVALIPRTPTFYVNTNYFNNGGGESPGVAIAANGNVIIGWEDDGSGIADFESVWSLFDSNGNLLTPPTVITNFDGTASITNTFLSYFRTNGTPIPGAYAFAPKIKANLFGNGIGMGAVAYDPIGSEIGYLEAINEEDGGAFGDFPAVQTLNNDGSPASATGVLTGVSDADAQPTGNIRIGDWDYLSNGNIVIVDESRQNDDLVNRFGGAAAGNHATFRIVSPAGAEVKAYSLVSANPTANSIWHGSGVTSNGFAVRFNSGGTKVRMFDNTGNPTSADIDLATLTGIAATSGGGRGDGTGFHGNGKDAYLYVTSGAGGVYITVLNANGTLRYARNVADTNETIVADRVDGAITPDGRVIAVWDSALANARGDVTNRLVQARLFSASGQPMGGRFVVSEWENPANTNTVNVSQIPRVAWRGNTIAVIWLSQNAPTSLSDPLAPPYPQVIASRFFTVVDSGQETPQITTLSISKSGSDLRITWDGGGKLESASDLTGLSASWSEVVGAASPFTVQPTGNRKFYRVSQ